MVEMASGGQSKQTFHGSQPVFGIAQFVLDADRGGREPLEMWAARDLLEIVVGRQQDEFVVARQAKAQFRLG